MGSVGGALQTIRGFGLIFTYAATEPKRLAAVVFVIMFEKRK